MGGDHGPRVTVPAALEFLARQPEVALVLVGAADAIQVELGLERVAHADQHHVDLGHPRLEFERSRDRHMGAVVAAHAIDRDGDQCGYSSSRVLMTFLPR
ncbi:MAG TPA: hypothetical protein VJ778_12320 [Burkholderiales bacterium]|nr:hypothetical protein [Burkholderiales bacterium]